LNSPVNSDRIGKRPNGVPTNYSAAACSEDIFFTVGDRELCLCLDNEAAHNRSDWQNFTDADDRMQLPCAKPRDSHYTDRAVYDYAARAWLSVAGLTGIP
jgi:hypothetical protein